MIATKQAIIKCSILGLVIIHKIHETLSRQGLSLYCVSWIL